jgi:hypothetical protein
MVMLIIALQIIHIVVLIVLNWELLIVKTIFAQINFLMAIIVQTAHNVNQDIALITHAHLFLMETIVIMTITANLIIV